MGCWNETCALTHTPITAGEECYMVLVSMSAFKDIYWTLEFPKHAWVGTFKGHYSDYGWLDEVDQPVKVGKHEYEYDNLMRVFISMEAAQFAIDRFKTEVETGYHYTNAVETVKLMTEMQDAVKDAGGKPRKWSPDLYMELKPLYIETMCFVHTAHMNRMSLFGASTSQMTTEGYEFATAMWAITSQRYEAMIAQHKKWDEEEALMMAEIAAKKKKTTKQK